MSTGATKSRGIVSWPEQDRPRERWHGLPGEQFRVLYLNRRGALLDELVLEAGAL